MATISELPDELLVKILSFLPTKDAVSTSVLSRRWELLWMWLPKLEFNFNARSNYACLRDFLAKNLPLHKAPIMESLSLCSFSVIIEPDDLESWVGAAVSRCVRELSIHLSLSDMQPDLPLPSTLYCCNSLVALQLDGQEIFVDLPPTVCLPSLQTLELLCVKYSEEDSLGLLLSCCPLLEDLTIEREDYDNLSEVVVISVTSLQRLSLTTLQGCFSDGYEIVTPSLKYFKVEDHRETSSYLIEHMPELEEADIRVMLNDENDSEMLLRSITAAKRLSFRVIFNTGEESVWDSIVFSQLEDLKLFVCSDNWSNLLLHLLKDSPNLQILNILLDDFIPVTLGGYEPIGLSDNHGSVPNSLETFKFEGYKSEVPEYRDFLSFFFKHASCLKSTSIVHI